MPHRLRGPFGLSPHGEDRFEIWSHPAELLLTRLVEAQVLEEITEEDYIADDDVLGLTGESLRWKELIGGALVSEIRLAFPSGGRVAIRCQHAELCLGPKMKRLEEWLGPLSQSSGEETG